MCIATIQGIFARYACFRCSLTEVREGLAMQHIPMLVVTGGPCAGKSTALAQIADWCVKCGIHPYIVPEVATRLINSGFDRASPKFQEYVLREIISTENLCLEDARIYPRRKSVIICDRGAPEGIVYDKEGFERACIKNNLNIVDLRDSRYSGVIFLQSAANGAEKFYTTSNNAARSESVEEARLLDERTRNVWTGAPLVKIVENVPGKDFEHKMQRVIQALAQILGMPEPISCERKFELHEFKRARLPAHAVDIDIIQTYLVSRGQFEERVRARGQGNDWAFFHTIKEHTSVGTSIKRERILSHNEYLSFLLRRDETRQKIHKTRTCFFESGQYFEVDQFHAQHTGEVLLEVKLTNMSTQVKIPSYLGRYTERTGDTRFNNAAKAAAQ
jgi:CYTH domain-containing protein/predicted ATPase